MECRVELYLFDARKWYSIFFILKPVSVAIRYDDTQCVIFKNGLVRKIKQSKLKDKITHTEGRKVDCRTWLVGKIWLDSCIIADTKFKDAKEFGQEYMKIINGLKWEEDAK